MQTDELVDKYVKLRDKKKALQDKHKKELEPFTKALEMIEAEFLKQLNSSGLESMNTKAGTVYKSLKTHSSIADPTIFFDFVESGKHWHLIQKRLNNPAINEFIEETGTAPPGINLTQTVDIGVRRA